MPLEELSIVLERVAPRPIEELVRVLVDGIGEGRLGVLGIGGREAVERVLTDVEAEARSQSELRRNRKTAKCVSEDAIVLVDVVLVAKRIMERITLVAEARCLPAREVAVDIINRDDGLHENVLTKDAILGVAAWVIGDAARVLLERKSRVLPEAQLPTIERRVDADTAALEGVVNRRAVLIEVVERHAVGVVLTAARHVEIVVRDRRWAEHRLPPIRTRAAGHDQRGRILYMQRFFVLGRGRMRW